MAEADRSLTNVRKNKESFSGEVSQYLLAVPQTLTASLTKYNIREKC